MPSDSLELKAASVTTSDKKATVLAYSGGIMSVKPHGSVAIDLAGCKTDDRVSFLCDHKDEMENVIGHGVPRVVNGQLYVEGVITPGGEAADRIIELKKSGTPLQASVGVTFSREDTQRIREGETVHVNGRAVTAPAGGFMLICKSRLREVSIVVLGADPETVVEIQAKRGKENMSIGLETTNTVTIDETEKTRRDEIRKLCAGGHADIQAQAIDEGWDVERAELHVLRAQNRDLELKATRDARPLPPPVHSGHRGSADGREVLEAAAMLHFGHESLAEKELGERACEQARSLRCNSMVDLCKASLQLEHVDFGSHTRDQMVKASFSTISLPIALSNVANKVTLAAYNAFPSSARLIAKSLTSQDFKEHTGFRLTGDFEMEEVAADGEIAHGVLKDSGYTYQVATYARMLTLTRQDVINDDTGAFSEIPRILGRGAAIALEKLFWTMVLGNAENFFHADNANYLSGAATALSDAGLAAAVELFLKQVDQDDNPISVVPKYLTVPPELKVTADSLYNSVTLEKQLAEGGSEPDINAFHGLYQPATTPYLSASGMSGSSSKAWYLFGDPSDVAAFGIAYLNGREHPTIEQVDMPGHVLGIGWRGYLDFGVCQIDPRGAVKAKGEA